MNKGSIDKDPATKTTFEFPPDIILIAKETLRSLHARTLKILNHEPK